MGKRSAALATRRQQRGALVSVMIATYNRPELLIERSIPSVLAQTHRNIDLHVVGDGATPEVLEAVAKIKDPRVRFTQRPRPIYPPGALDAWHISGSWAWNYAIDTAKGNFLCGIGDDDEYLPTYVEELLDALLTNNWGAAYCRSEVVGHGFLGAWPPRHAGQSGGELMWRKNDIRLDPECWRRGLPNDWDFWSRMIASGVNFGFLPKVLYRYFPTNHIPPCLPY